MAQGKTDQLLLRPSIDLIGRLERAAERFGKRSRNEVALEVLDLFLEHWEHAEAAKHAVIEQQRAGLVEISEPYMKGRANRREIERVRKDAESRERAKKRK